MAESRDANSARLYRLFISYSRIDHRIVVPLVALLSIADERIFVDIGIRPGSRWRAVLADAIDACEILLLFWCHHSNSSAEVKKEYVHAIAAGKTIVPVLLDDTPLNPDVAQYQAVDLPAALGEHEGYVDIAEHIPSATPGGEETRISRRWELLVPDRKGFIHAYERLCSIIEKILNVQSFTPDSEMPAQGPNAGSKVAADSSARTPVSLRQSSDAGLSDSLVVISPSELEAHIRVSHQAETEIAGLLISIVNRGERTLDSCRAIVEGFRSFDSKRQSFRVESAGTAEIVTFRAVRPDYESGSYWLVRINKQSERLETGNDTRKVVMMWPPKDPASTQKWLLALRIDGEVRTDQARPQPLPVWRFDVCIEWTRPNTLKVGHLPQ
jgi:TIR domain